MVIFLVVFVDGFSGYPSGRSFLGLRMIVSQCHSASVHVYSADEGTSFYVCDDCHQACDTRCSFELPIEGLEYAEV